jgi:Nitrile hydratase, alpha chain
MNEKTPQRSRQEIEAHLVAKTWKDESFKQQLLSNPKAVIEKEFGVQLPAELNVQIVEEDAQTLYINLPMRPDFSGTELSDRELEAVAGGTTPVCGAITVAAAGYHLGKETSDW